MTGAAPRAASRRSPAVVLAATVAGTTLVLGLTTGVGPLVGPLADGYRVGTAEVSLVLSVMLCAALGLGVVTGPLAERYGARLPVGLAALLLPAGLLVAAAGDRFAVAGVALAVGVGGGAGCVVVPLTAAAGTAFARHRGAALVVATVGGGLATIVAPPVTVALLDGLGLRGTLVALAAAGALVLGACAAAAPGSRDVGVAGRPGSAGDGPGLTAVLAEPGLARLLAATVALAAAMFVPIVHLPGYAVAHDLPLAAGAALVTLAGTAGLVARLGAVPAVARWGAWPVQRAGAAVFTAALVTWPSVDGWAGLVAVVVGFGLGHGTYVGVSGAVVAQLWGPRGIGLRLGLFHLAAAVGALVGPSTAGVAADLTGTPVASVALAACLGIAGCALQATVRTRVDGTGDGGPARGHGAPTTTDVAERGASRRSSTPGV